ncbi:MAG: ribonuclease H family protein [Candidatus Binataceae bacterium]
MAEKKRHYLVYADGSCLGNPGPGGWGVVIVSPDGARTELSGHQPATTNNRMEITAAIEALSRIPRGADVTLRSDSEYVVNTMIRGWKRKANGDLWQRLDEEAGLRTVAFEWVRGHGSDPLNSRADELALAAAQGKTASATEVDIAPMLKVGESIAKCAACGRAFVSKGAERYCSLVECQLRRRASS